MIEISEYERRRAFSGWLRTGRLPSVRANDGRELKFNPWHDPKDGRFTFAATGVRGSGNSSEASRRSPEGNGRPSAQTPRPVNGASAPNSSSSERHKQSPKKGWAGGGFTGGGGGGFGGGGATGTWGAPATVRKSPDSPSEVSGRVLPAVQKPVKKAVPTPVAKPPPEKFETIVRNGYTYKIDAKGRDPLC